MKYADLTGLRKVYDKVCELYGQHGYHWRPAPLLERLAKEGSTFSAYDKKG
ncbi:MAG: hypothetical protein JNL98_03555 [Bryobacterales bacterium]|nr:hypothetical protein [Bryobacterales bacterium]